MPLWNVGIEPMTPWSPLGNLPFSSTSSYRLSPHVYYQTWKHYAYSKCIAIPSIIKTGTISLAHNLDYFEHTKKKPIVEASNSHEFKHAKYPISTTKLYALQNIYWTYVYCPVMKWCKRSMHPTLCLASSRLNLMGVHQSWPIWMNTFAWNGKWECQPRWIWLTNIPPIFCFRW